MENKEVTVLFDRDGNIIGVTQDTAKEYAELHGFTIFWGRDGGEFSLNGRVMERFILTRML